MDVVVTGGAGFIGSHLCERLLGRGHRVFAVDSFDPFYDPAAKRRNVEGMAGHPAFALLEHDVRDGAAVREALRARGAARADAVVHLAARGGVRPSIDDPALYARVNVEGTTAVLELARGLRAPGFVFASSSSVYGNDAPVPFAEDEPAARPISPYAASKRAGELLCHVYHHLYGLSVACLRLFTVYGPRQRPDLAIHDFTRRMAAGEPVPVFGDGSTRRDYTYVDDVVDGIEGALAFVAAHPGAYEVFNLGESDTVTLERLVALLAGALGVHPRVRRLPPQPGDVRATCADISRARRMLGYAPRIRIEEGIPRFVAWFRAQQAAGGAA